MTKALEMHPTVGIFRKFLSELQSHSKPPCALEIEDMHIPPPRENHYALDQRGAEGRLFRVAMAGARENPVIHARRMARSGFPDEIKDHAEEASLVY